MSIQSSMAKITDRVLESSVADALKTPMEREMEGVVVGTMANKIADGDRDGLAATKAMYLEAQAEEDAFVAEHIKVWRNGSPVIAPQWRDKYRRLSEQTELLHVEFKKRATRKTLKL